MDKLEPDLYNDDLETKVPTPPDQQDVSPLDMVSEAVEEMVDIIRGDLGLEDGPEKSNGKTSS
jgi:hypothetical protein